MLPIEHKAIHLYRFDAYEDYAWAVDAYGAYQPASFIYLCFESFKNLCRQYGLQLLKPNELQESPFGLIIRLENAESVTEIQNALDHGRNVIALFPNEIIALYYRGSEEVIAQAVEAAQLLGIPNAEQKITGRTASNHDEIKWEEIETRFKGRLFVTNDSWISDGFFMERYGKTSENTAALAALVREFATFKNRVVRVHFKNQVAVWPTQEPITFIMEIVNHGPDIDKILVSFEVHNEFEPISPTERELVGLPTLSRSSLAFQALPRTDGVFAQPFTVSLIDGNGEKIPAYLSNWSLEITPSIGSALRSHTKQDDATLSRLLAVFKNTDLFSDVSVLPELANVDVRACLNRMRTVAEKLVYLVLENKGKTLSTTNFASAIRLAQTSGILSARSIGYLHTVRVIGNLASHPSNSSLTDTDVRIVSYALACVMEEIIDKRLI